MRTTTFQFIVLLWLAMFCVGAYTNVHGYVQTNNNADMNYTNEELTNAMFYDQNGTLTDPALLMMNENDLDMRNEEGTQPSTIFDRLDWLLDYRRMFSVISIVIGLKGAYATTDILSEFVVSASGGQTTILSVLVAQIPTILLMIIGIKLINFWLGRRLKVD